MKKFIQILLSILSIVGIVYVFGQEFEIPDTNVPSLEEQINKVKFATSGILPVCQSGNDWADSMKGIKKRLVLLCLHSFLPTPMEGYPVQRSISKKSIQGASISKGIRCE